MMTVDRLFNVLGCATSWPRRKAVGNSRIGDGNRHFLKRRDAIAMLGGAIVAATPVIARAQQATPVVGYLSPGTPESDAFRLTGYRQGLNETGYVEGRNVAVEYRWAEGEYDRLP